MYVVVFTSELVNPDESYFEFAEKLRKLAFEEYGCVDFIAVTQGSREVAVSRWLSLVDIQRWKQDPVHQSAQRLARKWYKNWNVTITEVVREYSGQ